eukprot:1339419-Heterocapsa_arctica.AAC.1
MGSLFGLFELIAPSRNDVEAATASSLRALQRTTLSMAQSELRKQRMGTASESEVQSLQDMGAPLKQEINIAGER